MRNIFVIISIILGIMYSSCSNDEQENDIESIKWIGSEERGKFIEVCFEKPIQRDKGYQGYISIVTKDGSVIKGFHFYTPDTLEESRKCFKINIMLWAESIKFDPTHRSWDKIEQLKESDIDHYSVNIYKDANNKKSNAIRKDIN